jgi:hypothetical protein
MTGILSTTAHVRTRKNFGIFNQFSTFTVDSVSTIAYTYLMKTDGDKVAGKRTLTVLRRQAGDVPGRVRISVTRGRTLFRSEYDYAARPHDGGWHVRLKKEDGSVYDVVLTARERSCDCLGFLRHGHCKHVPCCDTLAGGFPPPKGG